MSGVSLGRGASRFSSLSSMLGYSAQELILEPFAGVVLNLTPGASAQLTGMQHAGALVGMIVVALAGSLGNGRFGSMRTWTIAGCFGSATGLIVLALAGFVGPAWPLAPSVFFLGAANGAFAVSAIGSMMGLAGDGKESREGPEDGTLGRGAGRGFRARAGLVATIASDLARYALGSPGAAYATVFLGEAVLFLFAARLAAGVFQPRAVDRDGARLPAAAMVAGQGV